MLSRLVLHREGKLEDRNQQLLHHPALLRVKQVDE
jgi:hypothetical protein